MTVVYDYIDHKTLRKCSLFNVLLLFFVCFCSNIRTITEPASRLSDDRYVTADDNLSTNTSTTSSLKKENSIESPSHDGNGFKKRNSKSLPVKTDGTLDYDGEF